MRMTNEKKILRYIHNEKNQRVKFKKRIQIRLRKLGQNLILYCDTLKTSPFNCFKENPLRVLVL